ncbi:MAG: prepilin-type N-terminal cleavage/methylation domain-containing protein [Candidatus Gracilibacteria bacterium]|jgi:prepilin-type N-terminal cleavage/methylation domain-containing protein
MKSKKGFTLVELIIVIAIVAILAAVAFVAVDPARRLHESRNAARWTNVTSISDTLNTYYTDNDGVFPDILDTETGPKYFMIGTCDAGAAEADCAAVTVGVGESFNAACSDLTDLVTGNYLNKVPVEDIGTFDGAKTGYFVFKPASGPLRVGACVSEGEGSGGSGTAPVIYK